MSRIHIGKGRKGKYNAELIKYTRLHKLGERKENKGTVRTEVLQSLENDMKPVDDISSLVSRFLQEFKREHVWQPL